MTQDAIRIAFMSLEAANYRRPPSWADGEDLENAVSVWAAVLDELTVEEFNEAVLAWLRKKTPWWPSTGELLDEVRNYQDSLRAHPYEPQLRAYFRAQRRARRALVVVMRDGDQAGPDTVEVAIEGASDAARRAKRGTRHRRKVRRMTEIATKEKP